MKAWENFAFIDRDGVVQNVASFAPGGYTEANRIATTIHGDGAYAVEVTYIPCQVGDTCVGGVFYHNGVAVRPYPTEEEQIAAHDGALDALTLALLEV